MSDLALQDAAEPALPEAQLRSRVYLHPLREQLHALMARRDSRWISDWLADRYPVEDDDGPLPEARRNRKLRLSASLLESYRKRFLPELAPGVDILPADLEELIGRIAPPKALIEIERLEAMQNIALFNLSKAIAQDEELEMIQPVTLQAQEMAAKMIQMTADLKAKLGVAGYEVVAQKIEQKVESSNQNVNFDLHGRLDSHGNPVATEPAKLAALQALLSRDPDDARAMMGSADKIVDADVVEDEDDAGAQ